MAICPAEDNIPERLALTQRYNVFAARCGLAICNNRPIPLTRVTPMEHGQVLGLSVGQLFTIFNLNHSGDYPFPSDAMPKDPPYAVLVKINEFGNNICGTGHSGPKLDLMSPVIFLRPIQITNLGSTASATSDRLPNPIWAWENRGDSRTVAESIFAKYPTLDKTQDEIMKLPTYAWVYQKVGEV